MEGREISQVTGKGDLLKGFPQGESPCKSFLWLLCGKQAEGSQNRRQRPEGVVQMGDEPHGEDPLQCQTRYMFREQELTGSPERRPQGARRIQVARAPRAEGKQSLPLAPNLPHHCPPIPPHAVFFRASWEAAQTRFRGGTEARNCLHWRSMLRQASHCTFWKTDDPWRKLSAYPRHKQAQAQRWRWVGGRYPALSAPFRGKK